MISNGKDIERELRTVHKKIDEVLDLLKKQQDQGAWRKGSTVRGIVTDYEESNGFAKFRIDGSWYSIGDKRSEYWPTVSLLRPIVQRQVEAELTYYTKQAGKFVNNYIQSAKLVGAGDAAPAESAGETDDTPY